jgi:hypothetical protein
MQTKKIKILTPIPIVIFLILGFSTNLSHKFGEKIKQLIIPPFYSLAQVQCTNECTEEGKLLESGCEGPVGPRGLPYYRYEIYCQQGDNDPCLDRVKYTYLCIFAIDTDGGLNYTEGGIFVIYKGCQNGTCVYDIPIYPDQCLDRDTLLEEVYGPAGHFSKVKNCSDFGEKKCKDGKIRGEKWECTELQKSSGTLEEKYLCPNQPPYGPYNLMCARCYLSQKDFVFEDCGQDRCTDTDYGANYFEAGKVIDEHSCIDGATSCLPDIEKEDTCKNEDILIEYYCYRRNYESVEISCKQFGATCDSGKCVFPAVPSYTLTVSKSGTGSGKVTSNPAGIDCGNDCSEVYKKDTSVTLTATPDPGSKFAGWSGDCPGTGPCTLIMNSNKSVNATFNLSPTYVIDPPSSTIQVDQTQKFTGYYDPDGPSGPQGNQDVTQKATWQSSDSKVATIDNSGLATCKSPGSVTISSTYSGITATAKLTCSPVPTCTLTVSLGQNGSAWCFGWINFNPPNINAFKLPHSETYSCGTSVTLTAAQGYASGCWFDRWEGDVECSDDSSRCWNWQYTITMDRDKSLTAYFKYVPPSNQPPTAYNLSVDAQSSEIICGQSGGSRAKFSWSFSDPDGDSQGAYQIQIDNNSNFSSPEVDTGKIQNSSYSFVLQSPYPLLNWGTTYYWRLKIWDSKDNSSDWIYGSSFTTPSHSYPVIDFSWDPQRPIVGQVVKFTDNSIVYGGAKKSSWYWTFQNGNPSASTNQNPTTTFSSIGGSTITLKVTDSSGYSCTGSKTLQTTYPLPFFKEIPPIFFKIREFFASLIPKFK